VHLYFVTDGRIVEKRPSRGCGLTAKLSLNGALLISNQACACCSMHELLRIEQFRTDTALFASAALDGLLEIPPACE
jgi:hypothetical protein